MKADSTKERKPHKVNQTRYTNYMPETCVLVRLHKNDYHRLRYLAFKEDTSATSYVRNMILSRIDEVLGKTKSATIVFED